MGERRVRTPEQRLRVFISSTLAELAAERATARDAVAGLHLTPILFELGARPHPPRELYRAYLEQSDIFLAVYWQQYGWVPPGESISGLEDEYLLAGDRPKLVYVKLPAPDRDPRLANLLARIKADDQVSYHKFERAEELQELIPSDLALLLTERFEEAAANEPSAPAAAAGRVPVPLTSLIGREAEVAFVRELLTDDRVRLVTLSGPGGIGKSRLAMEVARDAQPHFRDGVVWVPLERVAGANLVPAAIASALGVRMGGDQPLVDVLKAHLRERRVLLVLDDFERLTDAAPMLADLLEASPDCTMLVTSRSLLRIRAERDVPLLPLALPPTARVTAAPGVFARGAVRASTAPVAAAVVGTAAASPPTAAGAVASTAPGRPPGGWSDTDVGLEEYSAVRLFLQRAREVRPELQLTAATAATIAAICRALDGLPLALELAAARLRVLPLEAILARLDDRLGLLTMGARDLPERQRTMRATIEWSHALLEPDQQHLFAALAVFVGSARLEDIEAVCGDGGHDVLSCLDALVDQSLVQSSEVAAESRFAMLATIHEFARERLEALPDGPAIHERHARRLLALAEEAELAYRGPRQAEFLERLEGAHDELRAALGWSIANEPPLAASLAGSLSRFWLIRGHLEEGRNWLRQALAATTTDQPLPDEVRAKALAGSGMLTILEGTYDTAQAELDSALALYRTRQDAAGVANVLNLMGIVAILRDDPATAEQRYSEAIEAYRAASELRGLFAALSNLGSLHTQRGDYAGAAELAREGLEVSRQLGDTSGVAGALSELAWATFYAGDPETARASFRESLQLGRDLDDRLRIADDLDGLARAAASTGQPLVGARLWGAAARLIEELGNTPLTSDQRARYEQALAEARDAAGSEAFEAAWAAGRALTLRAAIDEALA